MSKIGIIGGSGLDDPSIISNANDVLIGTPYGETSSPIKEGKINGESVALLARHGRDHSISPSNVNFRANIWALKELGCDFIIATTAVGSLREEIEPGHIVLPNQFIDFTKKRKSTYFDGSEVIHTPMAEPFSNELINLIYNTIDDLGFNCHKNRTVITIEGPRFSTKSESNMFRLWGADVINMSTCPEAALAREIGLQYSSIAMTTDYDCWKDDEEAVSWELIQKIMSNNSSNVLMVIEKVIPLIKNLDI